MTERFYSYNRYLKGAFGERVHRISIDAGLNCPNLDGTINTEGCHYCNNNAFARYAGTQKSIESQIEESIKFYGQRFGVKKFIAYFQAFSNTHDSPQNLKVKYDIIKKYPEIVGLTISTRPDSIDAEKLDLISQYQKDYLVWVEYGLQTTRNDLLARINRNHTYEDFLKTLDMTRKYGIDVGVHIILGLAGPSHDDMIHDARRLAGLDIQGIKFHVLHVLKDSRLEGSYKKGGIQLMSKDEYVRSICDFLEEIPASVVVLRLISTAFKEYLIAPLWINDKSAIISEINKELAKRGTYQGYRYEGIGCKSK